MEEDTAEHQLIINKQSKINIFKTSTLPTGEYFRIEINFENLEDLLSKMFSKLSKQLMQSKYSSVKPSSISVK